MLPHCSSGKTANTSTRRRRRSQDTRPVWSQRGRGCASPLPLIPSPNTAYSTERSLLHVSVKQQDRLHDEFRDFTSFFFAEPLG